jgi:iron only hydrogenase large subunit-like protein
MACPGGCVNGGGQPFVDYDKVCRETVYKTRGKSLYTADKSMELRVSDASPVVKHIYKDILKDDHKLAHKLLHVHKD